jgi:hypothetical protein
MVSILETLIFDLIDKKYLNNLKPSLKELCDKRVLEPIALKVEEVNSGGGDLRGVFAIL